MAKQYGTNGQKELLRNGYGRQAKASKVERRKERPDSIREYSTT
jgi:hypothetical protein